MLLELTASIGEVEGTQFIEEISAVGDESQKMNKQRSVFEPKTNKNAGDQTTKSVIHMTQEELIAKQCNTILKKLPKAAFDVRDIQDRFPINRENSMNTVLLQEIMRFNKLY
jgi:dynein heavy chain, axonemal